MPKKVWLPFHIRRFRWSMYQSAWATIAEYNRLGDLNHRNLFSQFWRLQVQNQGVSWGGFWWDLSLWLQLDAFLLCPPMALPCEYTPGVSSSFYKNSGSIGLLPPSWFHLTWITSLKAPSPNTVEVRTVEVRALAHEGLATHNSIHKSPITFSDLEWPKCVCVHMHMYVRVPIFCRYIECTGKFRGEHNSATETWETSGKVFFLKSKCTWIAQVLDLRQAFQCPIHQYPQFLSLSFSHTYSFILKL